MEQSKMEEAIMKHIGWVKASNFNSAPTQVTATKICDIAFVRLEYLSICVATT